MRWERGGGEVGGADEVWEREEDEKGNTTSIDVCNLTQCVWPQGW